MAHVIVVGDGPGGLSAALFLAKNGHRVDLFGGNTTAMHHAHLHNYPGVPDIPGTAFQEVARAQAAAAGAVLHDATIEEVSAAEDGVTAIRSGAGSIGADYLILSEGKQPVLARSLGLDETPVGGIAVDAEGRSSSPRVYVIGRSTRPGRSQAIISAGDGAKAALDIMAREAGRDVQDWDTPAKD